jgi:hypothetical protein
MYCMECANSEVDKVAVALCHCCSAGLCLEHAVVMPKRLERMTPLCKVEELPIPARAILCHECRTALQQPHLPMTA